MNVKMHETEIIRLNDRGRPELSRTRVPGGWIYTSVAINQRISTVFVPCIENVEINHSADGDDVAMKKSNETIKQEKKEPVLREKKQ